MKKILMLAFATMMTFVAGAQDFGRDKVVNAPTTWTFEQYAGNSVNKLEELNGLYLRASEKHDFKCAASHIKVTLADGKAIKGQASLSIRSRDIKPAGIKIKSAGAEGGLDCCVAFNAASAGKVFVAFRAKTSDDTRLMKIFFKGKSDSNYKEVAKVDAGTVKALRNGLGTIEFTSTEAGTFVIGGNCSPSLYAVQFIPNN